MSERFADLVRYFRTRLPVMLDGAVWRGGDRSALLRHAGVSLRAGRANPNHLPVEILRETLDGIVASAAPGTMAGAAPVGPRHARIWWDERVLDSLGDVLPRLENPRLVLRFYDVTGLDPETGRRHEVFDIDVELRDAGRTVNFWAGDRTYVVDLGYVHGENRFLRLARTNTIDLPRDGKGTPAPEATATSRLRPAGDPAAAYVTPDAAAKEWAEARPDNERRDWDAELVVHMLYRAFLVEGSRALRRAPALLCRDGETLREEYSRRQRRRDAEAKKAARSGEEIPFLIRRLDTVAEVQARPVMVNQPVAAPVVAVWAANALNFDAAEFAWYGALLRAARAETEAAAETEEKPAVAAVRVAETEAAERVSVSAERVPALAERVIEDGSFFPHTHIRVAGGDIPAALFATPVFAAAKHLRESLSGLRDADAEDDAPQAAPSESASAHAAELFETAEAKRLAKAGVRVSRMALTLEGRIRPGARLKVAGKLVHADADGNFRLECVLSGRRTAIPMRAGTSISGEARSLISVDWSKRAVGKAAVTTEAR